MPKRTKIHHVTVELTVKLLESNDGLFLLVQLLSSFAKLFRVILILFLVLIRPLLQLDNLSGVEVGPRKVATDEDLDVVQIPRKRTESADWDILGTCASAFELVLLINRLAEDMIVTDPVSATIMFFARRWMVPRGTLGFCFHENRDKHGNLGRI
jgi:hypothetical protein